MAFEPGKFRIVCEENPENRGSWSVNVEAKGEITPDDVPDGGQVGMILLALAQICLRRHLALTREGGSGEKPQPESTVIPASSLPPDVISRLMRGMRGPGPAQPPGG